MSCNISKEYSRQRDLMSSYNAHPNRKCSSDYVGVAKMTFHLVEIWSGEKDCITLWSFISLTPEWKRRKKSLGERETFHRCSSIHCRVLNNLYLEKLLLYITLLSCNLKRPFTAERNILSLPTPWLYQASPSPHKYCILCTQHL